MTPSQAYEAGKLAQWEAEHLVEGEVSLAQFNQDTRDSIRGTNNYNPNTGHGRESIHYAYKPDDVPDLDDWREREMELI